MKGSKKCGYAGKIGHGGTQEVRGPFGGEKQAKGTVKYSGSDLRTGTGGKKNK